MTATLEEFRVAASATNSNRVPVLLHGTGPVRLVVGITTDQTCMVLKGRLRALREAGFEVTLVASPGELLTKTALEEGVTAYPLRMTRGISLLADLRSLVALLWMLLRVRPTITDFSTPKAGLLGNVAAWMLRVPHRVYTLRGLKLESSQGRKQWLLLRAEKISAECAHVVLCNSASLHRMAGSLHVAPAEKMRLLGDGSSNGVDTERFSPGSSRVRADLKLPEGEIVLGFVGRLTKDKGIPELLIAFDQILLEAPDCWLLLVGWFDLAEDALPERWRRHIAQHSRIRHVGYVSDTVPYYRAMDMLILPTHREGFPNVALEAAASGIPTITTECTGSRDAVVSELTGLLIPPRVPEAVTEAVLELIRDREKRLSMGVAAREWACERYDHRKVLALAVDFYRSLLEPLAQA
jgi:glycosyltransferase involved in cell wall biosynthesis